MSYFDNPLTALYISSSSGIEKKEEAVSENVIASRLARGRGGEVLRNMLKIVYKNKEKWERLTESIGSFFGYELLPPSGDDPIIASYSHSKNGQAHDLSQRGERIFAGFDGACGIGVRRFFRSLDRRAGCAFAYAFEGKNIPAFAGLHTGKQSASDYRYPFYPYNSGSCTRSR